ncbi:MAG TPA: hypothetical protein VFT36_09955 [Methylomirabilota bacterium]|nr:hypothetical protein [Methylomirabilota bacterium]
MAIPIESSPPPGWDREGIDGLLGLFRPGRLSEIVGPRSSGGSSLLLALVARITARGQVAYVDGMDALDPASAAAAGVDLSALLWVKCGGRLRAALSAADLLARCPGFALIVLDLDELGPVRASAQIRLQRAVEGADAALVIHSVRHREGSPASLVVATRRLAPRWMGVRPLTRLGGLRSEISIARSRLPMFSLSTLGRGQGEGEAPIPEGKRWIVDWTL